MAVSEEHLAFLQRHRLAIVGLSRKGGPPHLTPVYYTLDGEDILISTTASRFKAKAVRRNPEVSLCVIGEQPPFPYLLIYGEGSIEERGVVELMMKIGERMTGRPVLETARAAYEERAQQEGRVVLRVRPQAFVGRVR